MMQQMVTNGGLQYVSQIAVQYVYLDFDGELTSYNGEILSIGNVAVQDSGLTAERISHIVSALNALYSGQNVIFVTEKPESGVYSTVFIGKASAFSPYGNFAGLAETVDLGNRNKSDKAFVMLDSVADDELIISTISHETDHLLGTLDHGGEGIVRYAHSRVTFTGAVIGNVQLTSGNCRNKDDMIYYHSGRNIDVKSGGLLNMEAGTAAENVHVYGSGVVSVGNGAMASGLHLHHGGFLHIAKGGGYQGKLFCSGGGIANYGANIVTGDLPVFSGCASDRAGIINAAGLTFEIGDSAVFVDCTSSYAGGAINNNGNMTIGRSAVFLRNYAERGGAIYNGGNITIGDEAVFSGNSNWYPPGGAGAILNEGTLTIGDKVLFENNCGLTTAAVANYGSIYIGKDAVFKENKVSDEFSTGGVFTNSKGLIVVGDNAVFSENVRNASGTAILNKATVRIGNNADFINNKVERSGQGVVYNAGTMHFGTGIEFTGNTAIDKAGAIYNAYEMNIADNAVFKGNVASTGGAVCNTAQMAFGNNVVFEGNDHNFKYNWMYPNESGAGALYNRGTVYFQDAVFATALDTIYGDGTIVINGYVSFAGNICTDTGAELYNNGTMEFNIAKRQVSDEVFLDDWTKLRGDGDIAINIASDQSAGDYKIATMPDVYSDYYAAGLSETAVLRCNDKLIGTMSIDGDPLFYNGLKYNLTVSDDTLYLTARKEASDPESKAANVKLYKNDLLVDKAAAFENTELTGDRYNMMLVSAGGAAKNVQVDDGARMFVFSDGNVRGAVIDGTAAIFSGGKLYDAKVYGELNVDSGAAYNTLMNDGSAFICNGGVAQQITISYGAYGKAFSEGMFDQMTLAGGSAYVSSGGIMHNTIISSGELKLGWEGFASNTTLRGGDMYLSNGAVHRGLLHLSDSADVYVSSGAVIDLTVSGRKSSDDYLISGYSRIINNSKSQIYTITVSAAQEFGTYKLIRDVSSFTGAVSISTEFEEFGTLTANGDSLEYHNKIYNLTLDSDGLNLVVKSNGLVSSLNGDANGLTWKNIPGDKYVVEYSFDNFSTGVHIETAGGALDTVGVQTDAACRISCDEVNWTSCNVSGKKSGGPEKYAPAANGNTDVFFANANGTWGGGYAAQHDGILNGWSGTKEQVRLTGKNKLSDIFEGSDDANVLILTDDANGDALFVDDIFSALGEQARLSQIDEIRAGAGSDVIDLTSQRYAYEGSSMKICGGSGNDTIWANNGQNTLFGDSGNDHIIGGSGDDFIIGGSGDDHMHGGGGNDVFCFGGDWGNDVVEQLAGGKITLCIEDGLSVFWNSVTRTYSDGKNSIKIYGVDVEDISFDFEKKTAGLPDGTFAESVSEKIFEDKNKGMLA